MYGTVRYGRRRRSCCPAALEGETKMAGKRRRNDDDTAGSPPKRADPADDTVGSSAEFAKPIYLVAKRCDRKSAYSLLMVDAAAGGSKTSPARSLCRFHGANRGMSFVAAHAKHGSWIVGVGGRGGDTVIYDPSTRKELTGPWLRRPKHEPILISHGGKVYAISRRPKVGIDATRDFEPWFESLNFNKGVPCATVLGSSSWKELPQPPFIASLMTPEEFRNPPDISVSSYAAVGPYILMSLEQRDKGTYGFHVVKKTWEKVGDNGLPFVGHGAPLGGSLFAACGVNGDRAVSVFHMSIKASSTPAASSELATSVLSIQELPLAFPLASGGEIPQPDFFPLGKGSFCSIRKAACQSQESNCLVDLQIIKLTAFPMDNIEEANLAAEAPVQLGQHNHRGYEFNVRVRSNGLVPIPTRILGNPPPSPILPATVPMGHGRDKLRKLDGGGAMASPDKPDDASVPHPRLSPGHHQAEDDGRNRSVVYLALLRQDWTARQTSSPLYKVDVDITSDDPDSDDSSSPVAPSPPAAAPRVKLHRTRDLEADMSGKTFVFLQSSGWIVGVGVGGDPGRTIIFDTTTGQVIRGPDLVSKKWSPVVSVVGDKVYALTKAPNYLEDPDFSPWFEVLDLTNPIVSTEEEEGFLQLDADTCSWKALPYPIFFPHLLAPWEFRRPPVITVLSSVVVATYILVSLNQPSNCVFVFDTGSGQWHKVVGEHLPFVGAAAPRDGHGGDDDIFLAFSRENGSVKAYRIVVDHHCHHGEKQGAS
ncbi:hypothetical protein HU200_050861 [Digitaria exilis]|uniref:Uncharacterized protein n=1 Tax=Digitaria exilis TaxID=1010633 RepID=A0A835E8S0_9POAL|nr:hypothetical protein HU200_050861 [Digitaria exilis]CAB3488246.1 unnamed protein product [Digitaria exilis]